MCTRVVNEIHNLPRRTTAQNVLSLAKAYTRSYSVPVDPLVGYLEVGIHLQDRFIDEIFF